MFFYAITGLINAITSTILGFFVYFKNRKSIINQTFSLFCLSIAIWSYAYFFWQLSDNARGALFWSRALMAGAIFIPVFYLHFILVFLEKFSKKKKLLFFSYLITFLFFVFNFTPLFVKKVSPEFPFKFWPKPGIVYHAFLMMWFICIVYCTYLLFIAYKNLKGFKRTQIRYILIGVTIGFIGGSTNYFLWYGIPILPVGNILVVVYILTIAYAIIRYRLMDIRIGIRKGFSYFLLSLFAYIIFYATAYSYKTIWGDVFATQGYIIGIFVALAFTALFFLVQKNSHKFVNKYLYASVYNTQKTLENLADELHNLVKLDEIIHSIVWTIIDTMNLDKAGVLLRDFNSKKYKIAKIVGFNEHNGISRMRDNFLTKRMEETGEPLILEELELIMRDVKPEVRKDIKKVCDNMKYIEADCCLPMLMRKKLIGIIVLGSKESGEAYTQQDIDLLKSVASQASIAISNAQLYNEMEKIVKSQTKQLISKNKDLKKLNKDLEETLEAKNNFLSIASHQLRTPTSVIKGSLQMIVDGTLAGDKKEDFIKRSYLQANQLSETIHDLLSSTSIEGKGLNLNKSLVNIDELIFKIVEDSKIKLEQSNKERERNVELIYHRPKTQIRSVKIDSNKIGEAITNLIDNAIQYTLKGKIEITLETDGKKVIFTVKDTGIGISKKDMPKLFKKISRLNNAIQVRPNGTGLGLFITKGMIEKHGGKVDVKSDGSGKGTVFSFWIPIYEK